MEIPIVHYNQEDNVWFRTDNIDTIIRWSVLALPLIIVVLIIMMVLMCYNQCSTQTKTVVGIDPRHLNMNNSAWLPSPQLASANTKSLKFDDTITKATNLMRSQSIPVKNVTGMFHQNVYGDMSRKSISSCYSLEGELPESPIQQFGYDPMNPFQPNKTLKKQYSRLNELVHMTKNPKDLEC
ncbi:uncharacterized protein LOC129565346 [Sitodiplosis mosellana]|uniref:uncharacterized protein LOC129565346 n=1 Tax=Sitodiplosis mosellana TaxID=263140 RepID=UPI002444A9C9|nr:uncharacterized protein LOC129565346 [Sitodiplosis mosellana]XP_055296107.1 uncharacterized protein LOC129565346 [Sitodiplosis mosellana]